MSETTKEFTGGTITVWEIAEFLQNHTEDFEETYRMHNATIRRRFLNGELVAAKEQTTLLFLDVAKHLRRQIADVEEMRLFCGKVVLVVVKERLPEETINAIISELEALLNDK